ncbi:sulfatase family protein [Phytoactinopolyspora halotolerans]|uniref:Sulfatase-like hydrolase/transferase n=1 Tax=Phytoactinopolyspora halotolerans TaxID=1981512 RepID=A0A6L9S3D1_9ACTN|nr:sulfatase-like hydrolase/transferase [Phytoactinopolyspora halotolerans]NED99558.1 sulfatase-like hydrolase/transferase [Phytoactinopolyspora halotolerans]
MASRPAVLLITADQLRRDALGCYGNEAVATPNLDRLAADGTVFDCTYTASPWCLPSRSSLLTGRYPHNHGAYSNFRDTRLSADVPNLYQEFGARGYSVGHIGKCHYAPVPYGDTRPDRTLPYEAFREYYMSLGIEHLALQDDKQVSVWYYDDYAQELEKAGHLEAYRDAVWDREARKVFPFPGPAEWHPDAWVGRKTCEWINGDDGAHDSTRDDDRPRFIWASFSGPHFPFDAPAEYLSRVDETKLGEPHVVASEWDDPARLHYRSFHGPSQGHMEGGGYHDRDADFWRRLRLNYHANVALIDDQIGEIIAAAQAAFGDNLAVVFTCDHGEMLGNHGFWGKNRCFYDDVLRVPLILCRPGREGAGTRSDRLSSLVDVYPTLLAFADADGAAAGADDGVDGRHLDGAGHTHVLAEGERFLTVTDGRYKLVNAHVGDTAYAEMFDLEADPHEVDNMAGSDDHAAAERDLQAAALGALVNAALP